MPQNNPVILIVGAGPAGLMMACQLSVHKVPFRIIDKNDVPSIHSGALIVQARSLEIFEQMGMAGEAIQAGIIAKKLSFIFNGKKSTGIDIKDMGGNLSRFPFMLMLEQSETERLLIKFLGERGHVVERGIVLKSLMQDNEGITSLLNFPDGSAQSIRTKYLIAADGANSTIRDLLNIPFKGKTYPHPIAILDVKATTDLPLDEICFAFSGSTVTGFFPLQKSRWRIDMNLPRETEKSGASDNETVLKDFHSRTKVNMEFRDIEWVSVTHAHQKYAALVRVQNCFLIGDAAHVNTPIGAQGMNTGLQDAHNLAWKMAFVLQTKANPAILDSYSTERYMISRSFAWYADLIFQFLTSHAGWLVFVRINVKKIMFQFFVPSLSNNKYLRLVFFKSLSQINLSYRNRTWPDIKMMERRNGKLRAGDRFPDILFADTGIHQVLDVIQFTLLIFSEIIPVDLTRSLENYPVTVRLFPRTPESEPVYKVLKIKRSGYYLIRPDMHIGCMTQIADPVIIINYLNLFFATN